VPHKGDYTKFWMGAVQVVCERCHKSTKFEIEHRGYSCEIGVDGNPTDARHPWNRD
jgi:hypothetical protein